MTDATLVELCELFAQQTGNWVSRSALSRYLQKLGLNRKKKPGTVAKQGQKAGGVVTPPGRNRNYALV